VGVASAFDSGEQEWSEATINAPLTAGDRIEARENSRATLALTGRRYARLDPGATLDVLSLADQRTQLALRDGSALFDLGDLGDGELFEIATSNGAIDFVEPGLYQVGYGDDGNSWVSVLSGLAQVVGLAGTGEVGAGEILTLAAQAAAPVLLSKLAPDFAGGIVDDYYGYRYPDLYDGRYRSYDRYLDDPFYYDPYARSTSYRYINHDIAGLYDLDRYGDWVDVDDYGRCWSPRVESGWSPYRHGYWHNDNVWGPTWVSQEPWGWAPYHYGRWAHSSGGRWVWVPDGISSRPVYAPALVAFVPLKERNRIGWVPLAPGEDYVPRYYDASFNPQYLAAPDVVRRVVSVRHEYVNLSVPEAVTVVPVDRFTGFIRPDVIDRVDSRWIARSQPVLDPFAVSELRQLAMSKKDWKRHLKRERNLARRSQFAPVVASVEPVRTPFTRRGFERLGVNTVPDRERKRKLKIERGVEKVRFDRNQGPRPPVPNPNASPVAQVRGQQTAAERIERARERQAPGQIEREQRKQQKRLRKEEKRIQRANAPQASAPKVISPIVRTDKQQRKEEKRLRRAASNQNRVPSAPVFTPQARASSAPNERKARRQAERQQRRLIEQRSPQITRQQRSRPQVVTQQRSPQVFSQPVDRAAQARKAEKQAIRQQRRQERMRAQSVTRQSAAPAVTPQRQPSQSSKRVEFVGPPVRQAPQDRAQRKAVKQAVRQQRRSMQQSSQQAVSQPTAQAAQDRAQRKAEKRERKAAKGKP
jgi:hypothetical protein